MFGLFQLPVEVGKLPLEPITMGNMVSLHILEGGKQSPRLDCVAAIAFKVGHNAAEMLCAAHLAPHADGLAADAAPRSLCPCIHLSRVQLIHNDS